MGEEDGVPKTPEWARRSSAACRPATSRPWPSEWATKRTTVVIGNGGPGIRGPYATEPARLQGICLAMQGLGKPGANQAKMIEWGLFDNPRPVRPAQAAARAQPARRLHRRSPIDESNHPSFCLRPMCPRPSSKASATGGAASPRRPTAPDQFVHLQLPGRRLLQDPHGVDGLAVVDHLLERRQRLRRCHAPPRHRVHLGPAPLAGKRLPAGRHHPAGEHQAGRRRHRRRHFQRPVQPALPRAQVRRARRRVVQRLRDRLHARRAPRAARGVHRRQVAFPS